MGMKKVKASVAKAVAAVSTKVAYGDVNSACICVIYQPKRPDSLRKKNVK